MTSDILKFEYKNGVEVGQPKVNVVVMHFWDFAANVIRGAIMKRVSNLLLISIIITTVFITPILCNVTSLADTIWVDDFESYQTGIFPSPPWINSGNTDVYVDETEKISGDKSLKLFGLVGNCLGALGHRELGVQPPYTIHLYVYNGTESLSGCHSCYGSVALSTEPDSTTYSRGLIFFDVDDHSGEKIIRGFSNTPDDPVDGVNLGIFTSNTWYEVQISYEIISETSVRISYWINGVFKGSYVYPSFPYESNLVFLSIFSDEGSAWFDDVTILTLIPLVECNLEPDWPVVVQGGTLGFQGTIINNTDQSGSVLFATTVTMPNGNRYPPYGYLIGPVQVYLNSYQSKSGHRSQYIPHHAPLGTYTYHGYVGNYGIGIYDECTFTFTVNSPGQGCNLCHQ